MSERIKSDLRREQTSLLASSPSKTAVARAAILEAAKELLESHPFRDLTVGKLMQSTRYSRPTFYQHFNDLHSLMEALLDGVKGGIIEGAQPWLTGEGDPVENLRTSLWGLVEVGAQHGAILKAVADAASNDARLELVWESFLGAFDEVVAARIAEEQSKGLTPDFDPFPVACALNRMDAALLINQFGQGQKGSKDDTLSALVRIWLSTLYPISAEGLIKQKSPRSELNLDGFQRSSED